MPRSFSRVFPNKYQQLYTAKEPSEEEPLTVRCTLNDQRYGPVLTGEMH
jgi:hypothetical protein